MIKTSTQKSFLRLAMLAFSLLIVGGAVNEASAQRDPFEKPAWARTRDPLVAGPGTGGKVGSAPESFGVPAVEQRIDYYKRLRQDAVANGLPVPKVTSVLTVDELSVTGIFKTPRGYAAIVEATPIKLSYTIYPGDKFFNGQLVAVEENRLVFRKVTKISREKFVSSVENKPLRKYTDQEMIQGTAPAGATEAKSDAPVNAPAFVQDGKAVAVTPAPIVSPLTEMERSTPTVAAVKTPSKTKKPVRVASKKN
ncbi:MAG: hypothetical protein PSX80_12610 [bacterium]|nr:hypothetical protein [bacterium]